jgi:hypothetical protein
VNERAREENEMPSRSQLLTAVAVAFAAMLLLWLVIAFAWSAS